MTTLVASSVSLPEVKHSTMIGILKQSVTSDTNAAASGDGLNDVDKVVQAPSLRDAWQHFKSWAVFLADNLGYTAQDEIFFQSLIDKAAKMVVNRFNQRQQQSTTLELSA